LTDEGAAAAAEQQQQQGPPAGSFSRFYGQQQQQGEGYAAPAAAAATGQQQQQGGRAAAAAAPAAAAVDDEWGMVEQMLSQQKRDYSILHPEQVRLVISFGDCVLYGGCVPFGWAASSTEQMLANVACSADMCRVRVGSNGCRKISMKWRALLVGGG
jgi:hypothetical protein